MQKFGTTSTFSFDKSNLSQCEAIHVNLTFFLLFSISIFQMPMKSYENLYYQKKQLTICLFRTAIRVVKSKCSVYLVEQTTRSFYIELCLISVIRTTQLLSKSKVSNLFTQQLYGQGQSLVDQRNESPGFDYRVRWHYVLEQDSNLKLYFLVAILRDWVPTDQSYNHSATMLIDVSEN